MWSLCIASLFKMIVLRYCNANETSTLMLHIFHLHFHLLYYRKLYAFCNTQRLSSRSLWSFKPLIFFLASNGSYSEDSDEMHGGRIACN